MYQVLPLSIGEVEASVGPTLRRHILPNQVALAILGKAIADPAKWGELRLLAVREVATGEIGLALQTPPDKVVLTVTTEAIAAELGRAFVARHPDVRGVFGPDRAAWAFACGTGHANPRIEMDEGLFELRIVGPIPPVPGRARLAAPDDADLLQRWLEAFIAEALLPGSPKDPAGGARLGASGRTWLWLREDGRPVSMANNSRRVEGWWSIGPVYTPPELRGRGYATGLVAHMSEWALASGATGCTLFTDLANPVSNRIYERIGYRQVGRLATVGW